MYLGVDRESSPVHGGGSLHYFAAMIDQDQVRHADLAEVLSVGIDPEVIGQLRIAGGNVAGHTFVETEAGEKPERSSQLLFPVLALLSRVGKGRRLRSAEGRGLCSGHANYYKRDAVIASRLVI
jgi:hypothetical protein